MDFAAQFTPIRGVFACFDPSQRGRTGFAVDRLPFPTNSVFSGIELDHDFEQLVKDTRFFPGLKALVQYTAGNAKPFSLDRLPLAASPQNVPDPIDDISIVDSRASRLKSFRWLRYVLLQLAPKFSRYQMVADWLWFCVILAH